ncbi:hypothetical protein E2C01_058037 [Portunus trituberculatus]|uniref:Uncharacterized protein n=1 Tax=Portunus trituberculatus TaxID=210409 RepID=A0A5B7H1Y2_PORTR|nr:hypothetical protein [Portunus trituberculatus]
MRYGGCTRSPYYSNIVRGQSWVAQGQVAVWQVRKVEPPHTGLGQLRQAEAEMLMAGRLVEAEQESRTGCHLSRHCVAEVGRAGKSPWRSRQ